MWRRLFDPYTEAVFLPDAQAAVGFAVPGIVDGQIDGLVGKQLEGREAFGWNARLKRIARLKAGIKALEEAEPLKTNDPNL